MATAKHASKHKHRAPSGCADGPRRRTVPFTGSVNNGRYGHHPAAHGGVCIIETCLCGYERKTNMNGQRFEFGKWLPPAPA